MFVYKTRGPCASHIELAIENGVVTHCRFIGGCAGNTVGLAKMVIGQKAADVVDRLSGVPCRGATSCPDQLAQAILAYHD